MTLNKKMRWPEIFFDISLSEFGLRDIRTEKIDTVYTCYILGSSRNIRSWHEILNKYLKCALYDFCILES